MKIIQSFIITALLAGIAMAADVKPLRVLLTYGGHPFQQAEFFAMWDALPGITYTKCELPREADLLKPGLEQQYDVIVMYDMVKEFTAQQQQAFTSLLKTGIGIVATHHNLGAHDNWPEYRQIIGGKYLHQPMTIDGKELPKSNFAHGQDIPVSIADQEHPITKGMAAFTIHDETYGLCYVAPGAHVLLTTDHPKCTRDIAWTTRYGNSLVCYLMLGHDKEAWANPNYKELLVRAIRWSAGKI